MKDDGRQLTPPSGRPALADSQTRYGAHNPADGVHVLGDEVARGRQVIRL